MSASPRRHLPALTGLRAVAALLVVLFHYKYLVGWLAESDHPAARVVQAGYVGVSLFFVLSGFILAYTYLETEGGMRGSRGAFWHARIARVYPMYLAALLIAAPLFIDVAFFHQVGVTRLSDTIRAAVFTPLVLQAWTPKKAWMWNGPGWSLSVEAFFYLLFPLIGVALSRLSARRLALVTGAAVAAAVVPALLFAMTRPGGIGQPMPTAGPWVAFLRFSPLVHLPQFVVGVATGVLFLRRGDAAGPRPRGGLLVAASLTAIVTVLAGSGRIPAILLQGGLLAPLFALLVYGLAWGGGPVGSILSSRFSVAMGEASYALYLLHMPLIRLSDHGVEAHRRRPRHGCGCTRSLDRRRGGGVVRALYHCRGAGAAMGAVAIAPAGARACVGRGRQSMGSDSGAGAEVGSARRCLHHPSGRTRLRSVLNPSG